MLILKGQLTSRDLKIVLAALTGEEINKGEQQLKVFNDCKELLQAL